MKAYTKWSWLKKNLCKNIEKIKSYAQNTITESKTGFLKKITKTQLFTVF